MNDDSHSAGRSIGDTITLVAGVVIILGGATLASGIVVPFLLSLFIDVIGRPLTPVSVAGAHRRRRRRVIRRN